MTDIYVILIFEDTNPKPEKLKAGMGRLLNEPMLTPTHASFDERRKPAWNPEVMESMAPYDSSMQIWRKGGRNDVNYKGAVSFQKGKFQISKFDFSKISPAQERELYDATERVAAQSEVAHGFLLAYRDPNRELRAEVGRGRTAHLEKVGDFGWFGVFPRMWFGPRTWPTIKDVASKFPGAKIKELESGTIQYDVVERPWELTDHEYIEVRTAFQRELVAAGIGADYSDTSFPKPGRLWKEKLGWCYR